MRRCDEFYDRVRAQGTTPAAMTTLYEEIAALKETHKQDRAALRDAIAQKDIHARETRVLALENAELKEQATGHPNRRAPNRPSERATVHPISGGSTPN